MQKIIYVTAIFFSCIQFNVNASEPFGDAELTAHASSTASSTTKLDWGVHNDAPITTGFFDRVLEDKSMNNDEKKKRALQYVTTRKVTYDFCLERIGANYCCTKFLQDETLKKSAVFIMSFFEEKLASIEKKHLHFTARLGPISEVTMNNMMASSIGQYSGELRGNSQAQAEYAAAKVKSWELIYTFVDQYPISKVSTNPIIQRAIEKGREKRVTEFSKMKMISTFHEGLPYHKIKGEVITARDAVGEIAQDNPTPLLNEMIQPQYDIRNYAGSRLRKWLNRLGEKEKVAILEDRLKNIDFIDAFEDEQH
jgi:hypothetical protein